MATFTTKYKFIKPTPNSPTDANIWGGQLNEQVMDKLDDNLLKTATSNISNTPPSVPALTAGLAWIDKNSDSTTEWFVKVYDGAQWVLTGTINPTDHKFTPAGAVTNSIKVRTFTTSGTYVPTTGLTQCIVEIQAAGGGAGSNIVPGNGGGGGGGAYAKSIYNYSDVSAGIPFTLGAAGSGSSGGSSGSSAVSSTFGSFITVGGGSAGNSGSGIQQGGNGGIAIGGNILNINGARGFSGSADERLNSQGGGAFMSTIGQYQAGGYGGGGTSYSTGGVSTGAAGAPAILIVTEYISS